MPDHIKINEHLKSAPHDAALLRTFIGQAHIAGTGPAGTTCRECVHWHKWEKVKTPHGLVEQPCEPGYNSERFTKDPLGLKRAKCNRPIMNKANRLIPHSAASCRFFEPSDRPLPPRLEKPSE